LRGRRDNDRFLSLIEGIAFLHQHQRTIGTDGNTEYIEASIEDYVHAHDLAHQVFAQAGSDLPKPTADFYNDMKRIVRDWSRAGKCRFDDITFSRRQIREETKLPDHIVKRHMRAIEELEYVQVQRAPQGGAFVYRLLPDAQTPAKLTGLTSPEMLEEKWDKWNKVGQR
jgi:DNA primase